MRPCRRLAARLLLTTLALGLSAAVGSGPACADVGVSITPGAVRLNEPVEAGSTVTLPTLRVKNMGSAPATFKMAAVSIRDSERRAVSPDWITYDIASFSLAPSASRQITPTVRVPSDAEAGVYEVLLQASVEVAEDSTGTAAPAAAARAIFTVTTPSPWWQNPVLLIAAGLGLLGGLALLMRFIYRRSGYTIVINKRDG